MDNQKRWFVGLDFQGRCAGALTFARWLHTSAVHQHIVGLHVIPDHPGMQASDLPELCANAEVYARKVVAQAHATDAISEIETTYGEGVEDGLEKLLQNRGSLGLIIGRNAPCSGGPMVALGKVARRLVRHARGPLVVVPRDLPMSAIDSGPVVLATDLTDNSTPALDFARSLAELTARKLIIACVVRAFEPLDVYVSGIGWNRSQLDARAQGETALERWATALGLKPGPSVAFQILDGPTEPGLLRFADQCGASMIVCGSRRLSLAERIFTSSVGTGLAARAPIPVAIVPFDHVGPTPA